MTHHKDIAGFATAIPLDLINGLPSSILDGKLRVREATVLLDPANGGVRRTLHLDLLQVPKAAAAVVAVVGADKVESLK